MILRFHKDAPGSGYLLDPAIDTRLLLSRLHERERERERERDKCTL